MSHGNFHAGRKALNQALRNAGAGTHEAKAGKHIKRAKQARQVEREIRQERLAIS
jgi:hypothetical protein